MSSKDALEGVREAVAVFKSEPELQSAIDGLLTAGFNRADLSLLASEEAVKSKLGDRFTKVSELEDAPGAPRAAYVSPEARGDAEGAIIGGLMYVGAGILMGPVAMAGAGLPALVSAAIVGGGTGGAIGAVLASLIDMEHANNVEAQLKHGGLLLWVRIWDPAHEATATRILSENGGTDVHVHTLNGAS